MKKIKGLIANAIELSALGGEQLNSALWNLIMHSPRMPNRLHQLQLIEDALTFEVKVDDSYFAKKQLSVKCFKWGNGPTKILLTHGWGSKALDFIELISLLRENKEYEIVAFDAPGNGESEGELTNLLLYVGAVKEIIKTVGEPAVLIGHSLGATTNMLILKDSPVNKIQVLISLSPLIKLKEHFISIMNSVNSAEIDQLAFFESFQKKFNIRAEYFDLTSLYEKPSIPHLLAYDLTDKVSPYSFTKEFLSKNQNVIPYQVEGVGHEKMHRDPKILSEVKTFIEKNLGLA